MTEAFISTLFRFINFGLIGVLLSYLVKRNVIPQAKQKIAEKQAALKEKNEQNKLLLSRQKELEHEIEAQERLCKNLYDQIKVWSLSFSQRKKEFEEKQALLAEVAQKRLHAQAERKRNQVTNDAVLAKALERAQKDLVDFFSSEKEGRAFTAEIVMHMREDKV